MRQYWVAPLSPLHIADGTPLANSTTLTDISPTPTVVIPANLLEVGSLIRVYAAGRFSTTATPTLLVGLYYGAVAGTAICATSAITSASGVTNLTWEFEASFRVRSLGTAGTALGTGRLFGVPAATSVNLAPASSPAPATIDTTTAKALTLGAQWGTPNAANTITCHNFEVDMVV